MASASSGMVLWSRLTSASGAASPTSDERDVDGDLLAVPDEDQVGVLDEALDRVALNLLGQCELAVAVELDRQQRVGGLQRQHQVVTGQRDVDRVGAVAVEHCGHLVGATDAASSALAELGARLGLDLDLRSHGGSLLEQSNVRCTAYKSWLLGAERAGRKNRVDHGVRENRMAARTFGPASLPRRGNQTILASLLSQGKSDHCARPSKRLVTEPSSNTSRIAREISGAIESVVSLSN